MTVIATICWARTSSGLRGILVASMAPSCIRRVTTAHLEQVAAVLGEDDALARRADLVPRPTDPLQAARDAGRALDLDHEVHGAHVDAQLERGRGDQGGKPAGLELLLDLEALLAGDAAVVGPDQLLAGQLVEALGEALAESTAVGEDDRAGVAADQLQDPRVDGRPDAGPQVRADGRAAGLLVLGQDVADGAHVVDRDDDLELERLARAGIDDRDVAVRPDPAQEAADDVERSLGGDQPDPLGRRGALGSEVLEAFEAQGQVGTTLRAGDGVDLVDDDVLDAAQDLAGLAREQQVQALRGRDEDVGRVAGDLAAVLGGRVAGAARDRDAAAGSCRDAARPGRCRSAATAGCARRRRSGP